MLTRLGEYLRQSEPLRELEPKPKASALVVRMNNPDVTLSQLIPDVSSLTSFYKPKEISVQNIFFTSSCWLLKRKPATPAGQVLLIGGRIKQRKGNLETPQQAFAREASEEGHIFGLDPERIREQLSWAYQFKTPNYPFEAGDEMITRNPKDKKRPAIVKYDDTILVTEIPYFQEPYSYNLAENVEDILQLTPEEIDILFKTNRLNITSNGRDIAIKLTDTLSTDEALRKKQDVKTDGQEEEIKRLLHHETFFFEAKIRTKIIERLLEATSASQNQLRNRWKRQIKEFVAYSGSQVDTSKEDFSLSRYLRSLSSDQIKEFLKRSWHYILTFQDHLLSENVDLTDATDILSRDVVSLLAQDESSLDKKVVTNLKKRVKLIRELRYAIQSVAFERNLSFIDESGPQQPFLFAQNLLRMDKLTPFEFELMAHSPEVNKIFSLICEVFEVNTRYHPNWYDELNRRLNTYRKRKTLVISGKADSALKEEILRIRQALYNGFAKRFRLSESNINEYLIRAWDFSHYLDQSLRHVAESHIRETLFPFSSARGTLDLDELLMKLVGVGKNANLSDTLEDKWIAIRTILLALRYREAQSLWDSNNTPTELDPLGHIFETLTSTYQGSEQPPDGEHYGRYRLKIRPNLSLKITTRFHTEVEVDLSRFDVEILTHWRRKTIPSVLRKLLERGGPEKKLIDDFFGRMIILDTEFFWNNALRMYPKLASVEPHQRQNIIDTWSKEVTALIINHYEQECNESNYTYTRDKVRDDGIFEDMIPHEEYAGSGASKIEWNWLKFVHTIQSNGQRYQEELQILPWDDAFKKKADEERFDRERPFKVHHEKYYPLTSVLYFIHPAYRELVRSRHRGGIIFPGSMRFNALRGIF